MANKAVEEQRYLVTIFDTPFKRNHFTMMPFRLQSPQEVFQKTMNMAFKGVAGWYSKRDDILVWVSSKEEHDKKLKTSSRAFDRLE